MCSRILELKWTKDKISYVISHYNNKVFYQIISLPVWRNFGHWNSMEFFFTDWPLNQSLGMKGSDEKI